MTIPASLLQHVEQHGCFSGCYGTDQDVSACLDPARSLQPFVVVTCHDCFARVGVPASLLPSGSTSAWLADQLTRHLRTLRGFTLSLAGYHTKGPGFWLSVAYFGGYGLFLLNGDRSRALGSDLDLLLLAFKHGVLLPSDPRMLDAKQYTIQVAYLRFQGPITRIGSKQQLLSSPHYRQQPAPGFQRVTLAEFGPLAAVAGTGSPAAAKKSTSGSSGRALQVGDICPVCGAEVRERGLLQGTFIGCLC
jgi:hypothetical protein